MARTNRMAYPMAQRSLFDAANEPSTLLEDQASSRLDLMVHDASRLAWSVTVELPESAPLAYSFEIALEVPAHIADKLDPWLALQSYARLAGSEDSGDESVDAFRRRVVAVATRLRRAREGFLRHCTQLRSAPAAEENHMKPLLLWIAAASAELARARDALLGAAGDADTAADRVFADELLSAELWTVLTDCARALFDTRRALESRTPAPEVSLDDVEAELARALREEIAYRRRAQFPLAEPANALQLERLLGRQRLLKKHFERVLFLQSDAYETTRRLGAWLSALAAMVAYLWFFLWQLALERHPVAIGSGAVAFALLTALAYASRERLKEAGRNWLAGRAQQLFAQRVTRHRLPSSERARGGAVVVSARESFSQSAAQRPDPLHPDGSTHDVTLLRFVHRGTIRRPPSLEPRFAREVRFSYRFDLSPLFPRLHDAVRGLASPEKLEERVTIVDVPRNYDVPVKGTLRWDGEERVTEHTLVLNKNGLLRLEEAVPQNT